MRTLVPWKDRMILEARTRRVRRSASYKALLDEEYHLMRQAREVSRNVQDEVCLEFERALRGKR